MARSTLPWSHFDRFHLPAVAAEPPVVYDGEEIAIDEYLRIGVDLARSLDLCWTDEDPDVMLLSRPWNPAAPCWSHSRASTWAHARSFDLAGRQSIETPAPMLRLFRETRLDGVTLNQIKLPHDCVWIGLEGAGVTVPNEIGPCRIRGAYVRRAWDGSISINAIGEVSDRGTGGFWATVTGSGGDIEKQITGSERFGNIDPEIRRHIAAIVRCCVNVLVIWTARPDERQTSTDEDRRREVRRAHPGRKPSKRRDRDLRELAQNSTTITRLGSARSIADAEKHERILRSSPESHRVRGHWRRFATGAGRVDRTWRWVMPFVRCADSDRSQSARVTVPASGPAHASA